LLSIAAAQAFDESRYPDFSGQWARIGGIQWDPTKPRGLAQQAPLTPEFRATLEASMADLRRPGKEETIRCGASRKACRES
jgi:hypothetical protein